VLHENHLPSRFPGGVSPAWHLRGRGSAEIARQSRRVVP
jgi:hypothetical protein